MAAATTPETVELTDHDRAMLAGDCGEAAAVAMRILITMAGVYGAERLLDIEGAHIDGCLYHGDSGVDFAELLIAGGARVRVPTTLNVGGLDLLHPEEFAGTAERRAKALRLMECYEEMGCRTIWTCAPYQTTPRPAFGQQVAWAESNAIVFANSVLGARTHRYGDFIDICAAITGRAPAVGLHLEESRRGQVVFDLRSLPHALGSASWLLPAIGYLVGERCGNRVPVLLGLAAADEDGLKALGAAAASSGAVALFHAVGITPEAPTLEAALGGKDAEEWIEIGVSDLRAGLRSLSTVPAAPGPEAGRENGSPPARSRRRRRSASDAISIDVVALGSPHFSPREFAELLPLVERHPPSAGVEFVVCTNRLSLVHLEQSGGLERLRALGVRVVVDTCVVVAPILRTPAGGVLMTNSGKFAHYAPGNVGFDVVFGSLAECVRSAHRGRLWRDPELWP
ncbi:MAG: aconitase X catalytic domain-containing protein [Acidobacteriota bacterium]|nr:aconitase X catalytic domain-containing protein [Acidobacteriota bacterium]